MADRQEKPGSLSRRTWLSAGVAATLGTRVQSQVDELFSRHVRVLRPRGEFVHQLVRVEPARGTGWRSHRTAEGEIDIRLPEAVTADQTSADSRLFLARLGPSADGLPSTLRIDRYAAEAGDPNSVDAAYVADLAEDYPGDSGLNGFKVTESGLLLPTAKPSWALVGGTHRVGAARAFRLQITQLGRLDHYFVTVDCSENAFLTLSGTVASVLLSLVITPRTKKP